MLEELIVILLSSFKFAMTFPLAILEFRFGLIETLILSNLGGTLGIFFFAYLSEKIIYLWKKYLRPRFGRLRSSKNNTAEKKISKPLFTKRNRRIAHVKSRYGLAGIAAITPLLLSIPVGVFLVVRYFGKNKLRFPFLMAANFIWSLIYTTFYIYFHEMHIILIRSL